MIVGVAGEHGVKYGQELAGRSGDCDLDRLTRRFEPRSEGPKDSVAAGGLKASDVEHRPNDGTAAANRPPSGALAAVACAAAVC